MVDWEAAGGGMGRKDGRAGFPSQRVLVSGNPHLLGLVVGTWQRALCSSLGKPGPRLWP